jgi:FixJ family two-component response regulator
MEKGTNKVFLIDDDLPVRRSLALLLKMTGFDVVSFSSAEEFLAIECDLCKGCILLDIFLQGKSGLELQEEIKCTFPYLPIIYITGQGDIPMSVQALKKGAVNFLQKPIDDKKLLAAVEEAIQISNEIYQAKTEKDRLKLIFGSLSPRECEVFRLIITGKLNKQIASELAITEHTVKLHRGKITKKLGLKSVAEMVRLAEKLNL